MEEGKDKMIDIKGKRIFMSGPMSGLDRYNVAAFAEAHEDLKRAGAGEVFDPAISYLLEHGERASVKEHADYMADCLHELTKRRHHGLSPDRYAPMKYDLLVSLPGWERSPGARFEREAAEVCGIEVCDLADALPWVWPRADEGA